VSEAPRGGRRLRVAWLSFDYGELCVPVANALSDVADVSLLLPRYELEPLREMLEPRVRAVSFRRPRLRDPLQQAAMCRSIHSEIRRFRPDVVHVEQGHLWFNLTLGALRGLPLVVTVHDAVPHPGDGDMARTPQPLMNLAFRRADQLIVYAENVKRELIARQRIPAELIHAIPHVAIGDGGPAAVEEQPSTVLFFGRIWPYKGLEYLIRAEPMISRRIPDARFVIAGEGEDLARYRRMMVHPDRFTLHNEFVSPEQRARLFASASVVVLPYVQASQSGVVPLAFSFARPVVVTSVGGLPEAVEDSVTGLVVPPRDERALADAVVRLLEDPPLRRALGTAGWHRTRGECGPEAVASRALSVYELAVRGHRREPMVA
jgi:glycosyltransferase involved in cell wall biosynthesis